jgi:glycolate oxidase
MWELVRTGLSKNTAGYQFAQDPIDWFIGSEGTLGVIISATLRLTPLPDWIIGLAIPCVDESNALELARVIRRSPQVSPRCIEYFDSQAVAIARERGGANWNGSAIIYVEFDSSSTDSLEEWLSVLDSAGRIEADVQVFDTENGIREARKFRHSVPATMNERGHNVSRAGGRKVSTDWAVPPDRLSMALDEARRLATAAGLTPPVVYGHIGNGHPHQNFIAQDRLALTTVESVVEATLRHVLSLGGTVAAEHGIGKLKKRWLPLQASSRQLNAMRALKHQLDPLGLMAPGNIL